MMNNKLFKFSFSLAFCGILGNAVAMSNPEVLAAQKPIKEKIATFDKMISDGKTSADMEKAASEKANFCQAEFKKLAKVMGKDFKEKKAELGLLNLWITQVTSANKAQFDLSKALLTSGSTSDVLGAQTAHARIECRALEDLQNLESKY